MEWLINWVVNFLVLFGLPLLFFLGIWCVRRLPSDSDSVYYDGYVDVSESESRLLYQIDLLTDPEDLKDRKKVVLKVRLVKDS